MKMNSQKSLNYLGIKPQKNVFLNLSAAELVEKAINRSEGRLAANGALLIDRSNGSRFGRSPNDRFIVKTPGTEDVWWGSVNRPFEPENWDRLFKKAKEYISGKDIFIFDGFAGASPEHRLQVRVVAEQSWHALFATTLFINSKNPNELKETPDFTVINVCNIPMEDFKDYGLNSEVFILVNFAERVVLIGGTHYGGEIKKSIFAVMNYLLPKKGVFPMHCSANVGQDGQTALFFGLSGTGKTTLSADPERRLIGDDEHGWDDDGIFNFEGGCYAKCINLSKKHEPDIYNAIRRDALLENLVVLPDGSIDFADGSKTENTRVSYPMYHINNIVKPVSKGGHAKKVIFLTADTFGVLPPVSLLDEEQTKYYFLSGYTAKVAGTERGIIEPVPSFSACFGAAFLLLDPIIYANELTRKMKQHGTQAWLVNTGWTGGPYGTGSRIDLPTTRRIINSILDDSIMNSEFKTLPIFNLKIPKSIEGIRDGLLDPSESWESSVKWRIAATDLALKFINNFSKFSSNEETAALAESGPSV